MRKGTITIEKLYRGWGTDFNSSNSSAIQTLNGEYSKSTTATLMRPGFEGHIAPGFVFDNLTDAGSRVTGQPLNATVASNGTAFCILDNARLVTFVVGTDVVTANYDVTFGGTSHSGHTAPTVSTNADVWSHVNGSGVEKIFYSWEDNTDADVGVINPDGTGQTDNFWTSKGASALVKGVPHKGFVGWDNVSYVTNGRYIADYRPLTDVSRHNALDLGYGWIATSITHSGDYIVVVAYRNSTYLTSYTKSESRCYFWDGSAPGYNFSYDINDNYVGAVWNKNGDIYAFTQGVNNTTKIKRFNGSGFETIFESAQIGQAPIHGGVDVWLGHIIYGESGAGRLLAYGSPNDLKFPKGFHYIAAETNLSMVKTLASNILYIGDKSGSTYKIKKVNFSKYALSSTFRTGQIELPNRARVTALKFFFSQMGTGASLTVSAFKDYNTVSVGGATDQLNQQLTTINIAPSVYYFPITKSIIDVNLFFLHLTFDHASTSNVAAIIRKIVIEFDYEETAL